MTEDKNTNEAILAFARAKQATPKSDETTPKETITGKISKAYSRPKLNLQLDTQNDTDPEKATEQRRQRAYADRLELENKRIDLKNNKIALKNNKIALKNKRLDEGNRLRNRLGSTAIVFVSIQLVICNLGVLAYFVYYICKGWTISNEVIIGWMTTSLVEVIGVLWVIARSLFPFRDTSRDKNSEK